MERGRDFVERTQGKGKRETGERLSYVCSGQALFKRLTVQGNLLGSASCRLPGFLTVARFTISKRVAELR